MAPQNFFVMQLRRKVCPLDTVVMQYELNGVLTYVYNVNDTVNQKLPTICLCPAVQTCTVVMQYELSGVLM